MPDNINLLSEELEPKGYIPNPVVDSMPIRPVEIPPTMHEPVMQTDQNTDVKTGVNTQSSENNFDAMSKANLNAQRPAPVVARRPVVQKVSFWQRLFGKKVAPSPVVMHRPVVGQVGVGVPKNVANLKAPGIGLGQSSVKPVTKVKFDPKKILSWLTAGKKDDDQDRGGINLVQSEAEVLPMLTIGKRILLRCSPAVIIIIVAYILAQSYSFYIKSQTEGLVAKLTTTEKRSDADIAQLEKNASGLDQTVTIMRNIFARHIYWTKLLEYLEQIFISEVYIKSMTAENAGNIIIEAQTDSFTSVAKQYVLFQNNPIVKDVSITGADKSSEEDPIKFSIKLKIWPGLMYPNAFTSTSTTNNK